MLGEEANPQDDVSAESQVEAVAKWGLWVIAVAVLTVVGLYLLLCLFVFCK